jgi:sialate O-acetylesterase
VGFWFAQALRKETGAPIGILEINWGGTRAEPWTDLATLGSDPMFADRVTTLRKAIDDWNAQPAPERNKAFDAAQAAFRTAAQQWWSAVNANDPGAVERWFAKEAPADAGAWKPVDLPLRWSADAARSGYDGVEWYRRTVDIPEAWAGKECVVELGAIDDADICFFDGRAVANTVADWTTARRYRVPGSLVKAGSATLALEVLDRHGEGGLVGDAKAMRMTCPSVPGTSIELSGEWLARTGRDAKDLPEAPKRPTRDQAPGAGYSDPASMFNAMIAPFAGLRVKGAIWYQGESNAGSMADAEAYRTLLPLTIRSWRAAFDQPDMPFGIVSLAAFREFQPNAPTAGIWPTLRDAQLGTERTSPNTGTITTIDVGDAGDIHPRDKRTVGERLARWAMAAAYGNAEVAWRGPRTKSARREGDGILVEFDAERGRLTTRDGKAPAGFAIAGADGKFVMADAELRPPNAILLRSAQVATPTEVRYAWQDNPSNANVVDEASKLPAHPFRIRVEADPITAPQAPAK